MADLHLMAKNVLALAKKAGADAAEVGVSREKGFNVRVRQGQLETMEHHLGQHLSISVYRQKRMGSVSISDLTPSAIEMAVEKAATIAALTEPDEFSGLADKADLAFDYVDCDLFHPWEITPEKATEIATTCDKAARSYDKRIAGTEATDISTHQSEYCYANSHDFIGHYRKASHSLSCEAIAKYKEEQQRDYEYTASRLHQHLASPEWVGEKAAKKAIERLGSRVLPTLKCPVIFTPTVAKGFWRHFIAAISGGNLYRRNSFLYGKLGEKVFPENIYIEQEPHLLAGMGSRPFDAEGVRTRKVTYVKDGVLNSYALGAYSARKLNMKTTGNSGGIYNLFIRSDQDDFSTLLKKMDTGLIVTEVIGQGVDILTGNYSRGACGLWVEKGQIQYPVQEITIAGNLKTLFQNVLAVGSDVDHRGNVHTGSVLMAEMTVAGAE